MRNRHRNGVKHLPDELAQPLTALRVGEAGLVHEIRLDDQSVAQKLMAFGIIPGARVQVVQRFPAYVLQIGFTQIALDRRIAHAVRVTPDTES